tara:strand:+ start:315 stop:1055 length:741 start_codon:yes stop_codon:yes gene_type:complete
MGMSRKPKGYWTKERCAEEALKYDKRNDFWHGERSAYEKARKEKWLDEICDHMTKYSILERHVYAVWFGDEYVYVGISYNPKNRLYFHMTNSRSSVYKFMIKSGEEPELKILTKELVTEEEAQRLECFYIADFDKKGYCVLNGQAGGGLGTSTIRWTKEKVIEEALKYKSRVDFQKGSRGAYEAAIRNGWLKDIPLRSIRPNGYWTKERCIEEGLKYKRRSDFWKYGKGAYAAARKNGWLDEIFSI